MDLPSALLIIVAVFIGGIWSTVAVLVMSANAFRAPQSMPFMQSLFFRTELVEKLMLLPGLIWVFPMYLVVKLIRRFL